MFKLPKDVITKVKAGEEFIVAKMGSGVATLCGTKVTIEVPSDGLKLGQRFFATGTNKLVIRPTLNEMVSKSKETVIIYKNKRVR